MPRDLPPVLIFLPLAMHGWSGGYARTFREPAGALVDACSEEGDGEGMMHDVER